MGAVTRWSQGDLLLAGGAAVGLAAAADTAWSAYTRFTVDLSGLTALERAAAALWDLRPVGAALFAVAACAVLAALREPAGRLAVLREPTRSGLVFLSAAFATLAAVVLGLAAWVALAGRIGDPDELGFVYPPDDRAVTLVTQALAWLPLGTLLAFVAAVAASAPEAREPARPEPAVEPELAEEMEALWRDELALGPKRERARALLVRIRALEQAGDHDGARALADEMRRL